MILGADLSYTRTGLVWLDDKCRVFHHATISVPTGPRRMLRAMRAVYSILNKDVHYVPDLCIIEDAAYASPSRTTVAKLKELAGVFKFVLEAHDVDWLEVSPTLIKKWVTGKGTAEKHVVARELKRRFGIAFKDDPGHDLSDAAALAAWGLKRG